MTDAAEAVTIDPTDTERRAAARAAGRITPDGIRQLIGDDTGELPALIAQVAERLLADLAAGRSPVYAVSGDDGVSPSKAAELLGVSRQFLDHLIKSGKVTYHRKPASTHRLIPLSEIQRLQRERHERGVGVSKAIEALLDAGADYE